MSTIRIDGVGLHFEDTGEGPLLVAVHGSWADATNWMAMTPLLDDRYRVVTYDRRGHSRSERPGGPVTRRRHEDDLAALIESLDAGPAHVVGNSFGGLVTLGLAARRPELMRSAAVHEPPALGCVAGGELGRMAAEVSAVSATVLAELATGEAERATCRFVEEIALGPGAWAMIPEPLRAAFVGNAPTFAAEQSDPAWSMLDTAALTAGGLPLLVTMGDCSPPWLQLLAARLGELMPDARTATIAGAGHTPHLSHPVEYADVVAAFAADAVVAGQAA